MKNMFLAVAFCYGTLLSFGQVEKKVGDFSKLRVYDRITAELVKSNKSKVEIEGDDDGRVEVINKNGVVKIRTKTSKFLKGQNIQVKVYYDDLTEIQASQGAKVISDEAVKMNALSLISNEGSNIILELKVNQLSVRGNSGGGLELLGKAKSQNIVVNSGASFEGEKLEGEKATILVTAGGKAKVNATETVTATVRAGGNIEVSGNPRHRNVKTIIGGNINFK